MDPVLPVLKTVGFVHQLLPVQNVNLDSKNQVRTIPCVFLVRLLTVNTVMLQECVSNAKEIFS